MNRRAHLGTIPQGLRSDPLVVVGRVGVGARVSADTGVAVASAATAVGVALGAVNWQPKVRNKTRTSKPASAGPARRTIFSLLILLSTSRYASQHQCRVTHGKRGSRQYGYLVRMRDEHVTNSTYVNGPSGRGKYTTTSTIAQSCGIVRATRRKVK